MDIATGWESAVFTEDIRKESAMQTVPIAMRTLIAAAQSRHNFTASIEKRLSYPGMAEVPPAFNRLAHVDFAVLSEADSEVDWDDYCPAYALGLLTYEAYYREGSSMSEQELKAEWDELRGVSRLAWEHVRAIIARSWNALARLEREGNL
jgi:hypothetical protein